MKMNKEILNLIEERLDEGKRKYGHENVETDGRNFITEALEEILDCCVYVAAKLIEVRKEMSPLPNHCIICDKPTMNTLCIRCKEKEMNVTGMLAIGNGEKCPYCETIMHKDGDTIGHMIENHQEKLKKVLHGEN